MAGMFRSKVGACRRYAMIMCLCRAFANCVYSARKNVGYELAISGLRSLKKYVETAMMDDVQVTDALCSDMPDFEDMLQYKSAVAAKCEVIVTRDKKRHFPSERIPVLSPEDFLNEFFCK